MNSGVWLFLAVGCLVVFGRRVRQLGCSPDWTRHGQSCYMWDAAQQHGRKDAVALCEHHGGRLVVPGTAEENRFVYEAFRAATEWPQLWLGFGIEADSPNGSAVCPRFADDGEELSYCNLYRKGSQTDEVGCGVMSRNTGMWRGAPCGHHKFTMCERECHTSVMCLAVPAPAPGCGQPHGCCRLVTGHTLAVVPVKLPIQCCMECLAEPGCRSFNLIGKTSCQLNNITASASVLSVSQSLNDCGYYEPAF